MYVKLRISKARPGRAEDYAREKNILENEIRRNLFSSTKSPADEMIQTARKFGKWKTEEERKTFSLVFSPNPKDNPTEEQLVEIIEATMDRFFPAHQCVIVLHRDKVGTSDSRKLMPVLHGHCYGSIIDPITGKNMHISQGELNEIRKWIDAYALEHFGWTPLERTRDRRAHSRYGNDALRAMKAKGQYSWKEDMASRILWHYFNTTDYQDFLNRLSNEGIGVVSKRRSRRTGKEFELPELMFSFKYKGKTMMVRASTISDKLSPSEMRKHFDLGGTKNVRSEGRYAITQAAGPKGLGSRSCSGQQHGANNGERSQRVDAGKIDFHCIECTHDKEICEQCSRYDVWRGGIGNVRDARAR